MVLATLLGLNLRIRVVIAFFSSELSKLSSKIKTFSRWGKES